MIARRFLLGKEHWQAMWGLVDRLLPADRQSLVVEVGSQGGRWAAGLASRFRSRIHRIYCVDIWEDLRVLDAWVDHVGACFLDTIFPLVGSSRFWGTRFPLPIDFLYIDADHGHDAVVEDIELWTPKVKIDAPILFHDANQWGVRQALRDKVGLRNTMTEKVGPKTPILTAWTFKAAIGFAKEHNSIEVITDSR